MKALGSFLRVPLRTKAMVLEAALFLLTARLLVKHVAMRRWRHLLSTAEESAPPGGWPAGVSATFIAADPDGPGRTAAGEHRPSAPEREAPAGTAPRDRSAISAPAAAPCSAISTSATAPRLARKGLIRRVERIVSGTARHVPFQAVCLPQAVAMQWMLRRRGIGSRLLFGARRKAEGTELEFHAWLTVAGKCVIGGREREIETYSALPPFDSVVSQSR